jgi:hypothetical protein
VRFEHLLGVIDLFPEVRFKRAHKVLLLHEAGHIVNHDPGDFD